MNAMRILIFGIVLGASYDTNGQLRIDWGVHRLRIDSLVSILETANRVIKVRIPEIIIWVRLDDLSCGACLEDFIAISSVVSSSNIGKKGEILYLVEKDRRPLEILERVVDRWKQIHSIPFPVYIIEGFGKLGLQKSCVLIKQDEFYIGEYMPMSNVKRGTIISRIVN